MAYTQKQFEQVKRRYNKMMNSMCLEYLTIGQSLSENTEKWNIRDMVSESQYQLDCHYEEGNCNSDGITVSNYLDIYGGDIDDAIYAHKQWLSETGKLRRFINYALPFCQDEKCTQGHCSKYDN